MSRHRRSSAAAGIVLGLPALLACASPGGGNGGAASAAPSPRIHDGSAAFFRFWEEAAGLDGPSRAALFRDGVASAFPAYYRWKFDRWESEGRDVDAEIAAQLEATAPLVDRMRRDAHAMAPALDGSLSTFLGAFPDLRGPLEVHLLHSLGELDGGMRTLADGRSAFLLGLDLIARHHPEGDLTPFFHHELFHVYHVQRFDPDGDPGLPGGSVAVALWMEGLASAAAAALNPDAGPRDLLLDVPAGTWDACLAREGELAGRLLRDLRSSDRKTYAKWFLLGHGGDQPDRAGYVLGYRIVREWAGSRDLRDLATMKAREFVEMLEERLAALRAGE